MSSIQGFRCGQCRAELLTTSEPANLHRSGWTPPVLCCGQPLRPLDTGQVLSIPLVPRRVARCPRCSYKVCLIVQPISPLVCMVCQMDFVILGGHDVEREQEIAASALSHTSS